MNALGVAVAFALELPPGVSQADVGRQAVVRLAQAPGGPVWMATPQAITAVTASGSSRSVCARSFGAGPLAPVLAASPDGTLYVARFDGLFVVRGAVVSRVAALAGRWVTGVAVRPDAAAAALVTVATTGDADNGLYETRDGGRTFARTSLASPLEYYESVLIAPSRPEIIYVTGYGPAPGGRFAGTLWVSEDGGKGFKSVPIVDPLAPAASDAKLIGVNPESPREIYLRFDEPVAGRAVILTSRDAGASFRELLVQPWDDGPEGVPEPLAVLGATTLVVATRAGLLVSHDDGAHFTQLAAVRTPVTAALAAGMGRVYVAGDAPGVTLVDIAAGKVLATSSADVPGCNLGSGR